MKVILKEGLQVTEINKQYEMNEDKLTKQLNKNDAVYSNIPESDLFHKNYLGYIQKAWTYHLGIQISPDILWYTLLSEICIMIKEDPSKYSNLFTNSSEKQEISVPINGDLLLDPNAVIRALKHLSPTNPDLFLPEFSTTTERSRFTMQLCFADCVSPYYNYSVYACGIPYIDVLGTDEDWTKLVSDWLKLSDISLFKEDRWFFEVAAILQQISFYKSNPVFWKTGFKIKSCGSGSELEHSGWFTETLFRKQPEGVGKIENFSTHVTKVAFKDLSLNKDYELISGLLSSKIVEDCLVPEFSNILYKVKDTETV